MATSAPESADNINAFLVPTYPTLECPEVIRNHIVDRISEWNKDWQPESLLHLFEGFLKRMPLYRLVHSLDMILPQLTPMHTRGWPTQVALLPLLSTSKAWPSCHGFAAIPFHIQRAHIYMVRIGWERQPQLLLYIEWVLNPSCTFRSQIMAPSRNIIQMGLPEGHSVLMYFSQNEIEYQAVLISMSSAASKGKRGEHAMRNMLKQYQLTLHGCRMTWRRYFVQWPCAKTRLASMVPSVKFNLDLIRAIRLGWMSRGSITQEKLVAWKSLEYSVRCQLKDYVLDVVYSPTIPWPPCHHRTKTLPSHSATDATYARKCAAPECHRRWRARKEVTPATCIQERRPFPATLSALLLSLKQNRLSNQRSFWWQNKGRCCYHLRADHCRSFSEDNDSH